MSSLILPTIQTANGSDTVIQSVLDTALVDVLTTVQTWAQGTEPDTLLASFDQGDATDVDILRSLHTDWHGGDFSRLPNIEIRSAAELQGANGAFAQATHTIYVAAELVSPAHASTLARVLLEEIGHFVDAQVNATDTAGDEGALFAAQVQGLQLSESQLAALQSENDHLTLQIDGQTVAAEAMTPYEGGNLDQFQAGVEDFLDTLASTISLKSLPPKSYR